MAVGEIDIPASSSVKNIGAILDPHLKMDKHVNSVSKNAWFSLYQLGKIKAFLSGEQLRSVTQAFVISKLDQNNGLLAGAHKYVVQKLQSVQNAAAKMIHGIKRYDRIEPPLKELHWLPVQQRIDFKLCLLTYKCLHGKGPLYLQELLTPYSPGMALRSSSMHQLKVPHTKLKTFGDRAFGSAAPKLWNNLPEDVKSAPSIDSFKKRLKTHYFKLAHGC